MSRRATIQDVASAAGLSVATVDRVLNNRAPVRDETARKVAEAAHRVGYHARGLIDSRLGQTRREVRLGFVLNKEKQEFYRNLRAEIEAAVAARTDVRGHAAVHFAPSQSPDDFADRISALAPKVDVIAASAVNHPRLTRTVQDLRARGIQTFALLNDFAQGERQNYFGINNMKAGRIAAWMLSNTLPRPGKLAVFIGGNRWHGHELRETGFRSYLREHAPDIAVLDTLVNLETRPLTYEATLDLLARHPDLGGLYCAGGGMEGAITALRELRAPGELRLVVHELTAASRNALTDRYATAVIATPLADLCRSLVDAMIRSALDGPEPTIGQHFLDPGLYIPESV